jgi:TolB-like protein/Tfp pilus assembly protein PilF
VAYGVAGWVLLQVADLVLEAIEAPSWVLKALLLVVVLGFVAALVIAWAYEMTPEGIRKENDVDRSKSITADTGRKMDRIIIAFLVLAVAVLLYRQIGLAPEEEPEPLASSTTEQATIDAGETDEPSSLKEINDKSIAVLPFTTRSTSEDDKFFSDGMHDDLLTQLAKIGSLKVISRTSMMEYRETTKNLKQIGLELGVANILEGAVQRVGKQVRINVQLIDTNTDEHLWAETYDREMSLDNLLSIQSEMSRSIAKAMEATLSPEEEALIERRLTDNLEALEAYRRAKALSEVFVRKDLERAELELKHALELDPDFAAAWAHLAYVYLSLFWGVDDQEHFRVSAREAIDQGRAIDPDLPELDIAEGYYFYWGHLDYQSALQILEPVLAIYPNDFELLELMAWVNRRYGKFDTALEFMFKALDVAPRDHRVLYGVGETYAAMRRFEEAQDYLIKLSEVGPANPRAAQLRGSILFGKGADYEGAARNFQLASIDLSFLEMNVWMSYVLAGDFESALAAVSIQADTTDSA